MILLRQVSKVVEIRDGLKLYIVAGGVVGSKPITPPATLDTSLSRIMIVFLIIAF
jgi:hypothetical protein